MKRHLRTRSIKALFVAAAILSLAALATDRGNRGNHTNRDRQTTEWAMPSQSMRDVAKEKEAQREAEDKAGPAVQRECPNGTVITGDTQC